MKRAFTLVELIVTLLVIGVIAALTIPTLMNSTNETQIRVGYKRAMSILNQAIQIMHARDSQCVVNSGEDLAKCFQENSMLGVLVDNNGTTEGVKNVLVTHDGIAYQFLYNVDKLPVDYRKRTLDNICGRYETFINKVQGDYTLMSMFLSGKSANCVVVVDTNGFARGASGFPNVHTLRHMDNMYPPADVKPEYVNYYYAEEQLPIILTGTKAKPVYNVVYPPRENANFGYSILHGNSIPITEEMYNIRK